MKLNSTILFFLLLLISGQSQANKLLENTVENSRYIQNESGDKPVFIVPENALDEQDSNDFEGLAYCCIVENPGIRPVEISVVIPDDITPYLLQVYIDSLLVDLPPPTLS